MIGQFDHGHGGGAVILERQRKDKSGAGALSSWLLLLEKVRIREQMVFIRLF